MLGLNPTPGLAAIDNLVDAGHLQGGALVDPVLGHWLRRRLPVT